MMIPSLDIGIIAAAGFIICGLISAVSILFILVAAFVEIIISIITHGDDEEDEN